MALTGAHAPGATPLSEQDIRGLKIQSITTQGELNEAEAANCRAWPFSRYSNAEDAEHAVQDDGRREAARAVRWRSSSAGSIRCGGRFSMTKLPRPPPSELRGCAPPEYNIARSGGGGNVNRLRKFGLKLLARTSMD
jgi:hypothetical protein